MMSMVSRPGLEPEMFEQDAHQNGANAPLSILQSRNPRSGEASGTHSLADGQFRSHRDHRTPRLGLNLLKFLGARVTKSHKCWRGKVRNVIELGGGLSLAQPSQPTTGLRHLSQSFGISTSASFIKSTSAL
jgi:hypothetical protein